MRSVSHGATLYKEVLTMSQLAGDVQNIRHARHS